MPKSPVKTFRLGNISASVFENQGGESGETFRSSTIQRSYRDGETTKYDSSFSARDLPSAIRVLQLAQAYIEQEEVC